VASRGQQKSGYSFKQPAAEYLGFLFINVCEFKRKKRTQFYFRAFVAIIYRGKSAAWIYLLLCRPSSTRAECPRLLELGMFPRQAVNFILHFQVVGLVEFPR
jgi:hypothetical protein